MNEVVYHFVFRTYKGKHILIDSESVGFLYKSFDNISVDKGFNLITCKILADHVHCLVGFDPKHRVDYVMRMIKGISAREFFRAFRTNRFVYRKLWGRSYYSEEIGADRLSVVKNYIIKGQLDSFGFDKRYKEPRVSLAGSVTEV
ncbi:MAG: IS200/IS605 family transposase [bacterium]